MVEQTDAEFLAAVKVSANKGHFYPVNATVFRLIEMVEALTKERDEWKTGAFLQVEHTKTLTGKLIAERDAALARIEALREALQLIEVKQPDSDGIVWVTFSTPHRHFGSFNLGKDDNFTTKVALEFEKLRNAALAASPQPSAEWYRRAAEIVRAI